jgi:hypothetical protein
VDTIAETAKGDKGISHLAAICGELTLVPQQRDSNRIASLFEMLRAAASDARKKYFL